MILRRARVKRCMLWGELASPGHYPCTSVDAPYPGLRGQDTSATPSTKTAPWGRMQRKSGLSFWFKCEDKGRVQLRSPRGADHSCAKVLHCNVRQQLVRPGKPKGVKDDAPATSWPGMFPGRAATTWCRLCWHNYSELFKASALCADAFYKSICSSVCPSVRLYVCPSVCSLLRYRLTVFLPPLLEVGCPIFLEIQNPWGKVMERSGLRYEHFCLKIV